MAPSNMTLMKAFGDFQKDTPAERNFRFGVREHGMGAIVNGMAHHNSGIIPYCATFFIFTGAYRQRNACCPSLPVSQGWANFSNVAYSCVDHCLARWIAGPVLSVEPSHSICEAAPQSQSRIVGI